MGGDAEAVGGGRRGGGGVVMRVCLVVWFGSVGAAVGISRGRNWSACCGGYRA